MESAEDLKSLWQKTELYLEESIRLMEEMKWVLAIIALHLHCEYFLKYKSLQLTGSIPKTHSLFMLLRTLQKHNVRLSILLTDRNYSLRLSRIERAYALSRISAVKYSKDVLSPLLSFTQEVFDNIVGGILP